jgi:hypothetical protein
VPDDGKRRGFEEVMSRIAWPRSLRYDLRKGGTFGTTKADPPPVRLVLAVVALLAVLLFVGWVTGSSP